MAARLWGRTGRALGHDASGAGEGCPERTEDGGLGEGWAEHIELCLRGVERWKREKVWMDCIEIKNTRQKRSSSCGWADDVWLLA